MRGIQLSCALLTWLLLRGSAAAEGRAVVAVFDIEATGHVIKPALRASLTRYLATKLAEGGIYDVVPPDKIKEALTAKKKESYKQCYEQSCQIEIGRELAAGKSLATQLMKVGSRCVVTSNLYDLRKAATERAASGKGGCDEDALMTTIEEVVKKLSSLQLATDAPSPAPAPAPAQPPPVTPSASSGGGSEIYFVDLDATIVATRAGQKAKLELKQMFDRRQAELNARQAELKNARDGAKTPIKVLQAGFVELQRLYHALQKELTEREAALMGPLAKGLNALVEQSNRAGRSGQILLTSQYAGVLPDSKVCDQSAWLAASHDRGALLPLAHRPFCRFPGALVVEWSRLLGQTRDAQAVKQLLERKKDELQAILDRESQRLRGLPKDQRERELPAVQKKFLDFERELQTLEARQTAALMQRFSERLRKAATGSRAILMLRRPEAAKAQLAIRPSCDATAWAIRVIDGVAASDELRRFCPGVADQR